MYLFSNNLWLTFMSTCETIFL